MKEAQSTYVVGEFEFAHTCRCITGKMYVGNYYLKGFLRTQCRPCIVHVGA